MSEFMNESHDPAAKGRFAFQHFDQECDFGVENANGERIRKKKRPGRKSNPPSIQERRAQNRAAQKAFREREQQRKEEKERQWKGYLEEIKRLRKQLARVQYEAKYLKACVLHLTLASLIHRGSVPHIWTESRIIPSNCHGEYKNPFYAPYGIDIENEAYQTPALLDMMLENDYIIDFDQALLKSTQFNTFMEYKKRTGSDMTFDLYQEYIDKDIVTLNKDSQMPNLYFPKSTIKKRPRSPTPEIILNEPQSIKQKKCSISSSSSISEELMSSMFENNLPENSVSNDQSDDTQHSDNSNQTLSVRQQNAVGILFEPPTLKTADDLAQLPPLQALHILRLQLKLSSILGEMTMPALLPTALQRIIPHDIRIDYVPGASIRDRMILFQDNYNIDDCFNFLTQNTVFLGGDTRDTRNWVLGPEYSIKFWFLSHQLVDQSFDECYPKVDVKGLAEELKKKNNIEEVPNSPKNIPDQPKDFPLKNGDQPQPIYFT